MKDSLIIDKAKMLAGKAHKGQVRKYTGLPYIVHPIEVANILQTVNHTDDMVAAALLHDVVEDCDYTVEDIANEVSPAVAKLVEGLTDVSKLEVGTGAAGRHWIRIIWPSRVLRYRLSNMPISFRTPRTSK